MLLLDVFYFECALGKLLLNHSWIQRINIDFFDYSDLNYFSQYADEIWDIKKVHVDLNPPKE